MFSYESGVIAVNTVVTSKEAIMKTCRDMVSERGLSALDMRSVAKACHVALGSLYNYFPSKDALVTATIESVWQDIFHMAKYALIILFFWLSSPISTHLIAKVELLTNKDCEERMKDR